jgi:hypothetical protein
MQVKRQKFSKEQQRELLQECMASGLKVREYAALKNIGYSTLNKWAAEIGISLAKKQNISDALEKILLPCPDETLGANADFQNNSTEGFSFINLTEQIKETLPNFGASLLFGQAVQENASPCGLEIQMPNGVMLKVGQVPFGALWPRIVEFVRVLA